MGFKLALNLGLKIGTKLVRSLAEKSYYFCELRGGGGGGLKLNLKLNVKFSTKFKPLN